MYGPEDQIITEVDQTLCDICHAMQVQMTACIHVFPTLQSNNMMVDLFFFSTYYAYEFFSVQTLSFQVCF